MTPNNEVKAKLFALYLGQKVFMMPDWEIFNDDRPMPVDSTYLREDTRQLNSGYLLLRSIEQLEDEEIRILLKLLENHYTGEFLKEVIKKNGESWLRVYYMSYPTEHNLLEQPEMEILLNLKDDINAVSNCKGNDYWRTLTRAQDYLRSIGIALPITYLDDNHKPVTASVSEQVEWGWVKLTTNK